MGRQLIYENRCCQGIRLFMAQLSNILSVYQRSGLFVKSRYTNLTDNIQGERLIDNDPSSPGKTSGTKENWPFA